MNQREKVEFFGRELERARKDFPSYSEEVRVAAVAYQAALTAESEGGDSGMGN